MLPAVFIILGILALIFGVWPLIGLLVLGYIGIQIWIAISEYNDY